MEEAEILAIYLAGLKGKLEELDEHCQAIIATREFVEARCRQVGEGNHAWEKWNGYTVMLSVTSAVLSTETFLHEAFDRLLEQLPEAAAQMRRAEAEQAND